MADEKLSESQQALTEEPAADKPVRPRGRPPLLPGEPRSDKKPRSVRLNEARWRKLQALGAAWLEQAIDNAPAAGESKAQRQGKPH